MNNAASVALFGQQRPAPETLQSLWKRFGGYREEKEGILSMLRVIISIHPLMAPTAGACDVYEQVQTELLRRTNRLALV